MDTSQIFFILLELALTPSPPSRFAQAPVGDLRFAKPQWPLDETTINEGTLADQSVACSSEEDCLFMDVWVPANASASKTSLPVVIWTYG